jgi:hypothetical protein
MLTAHIVINLIDASVLPASGPASQRFRTRPMAFEIAEDDIEQEGLLLPEFPILILATEALHIAHQNSERRLFRLIGAQIQGPPLQIPRQTASIWPK